MSAEFIYTTFRKEIWGGAVFLTPTFSRRFLLNTKENMLINHEICNFMYYEKRDLARARACVCVCVRACVCMYIYIYIYIYDQLEQTHFKASEVMNISP
jgi:hypothetical protein